MSVQPGWYPDPAEPSTQRYWDGDGWIGAPLPADVTPPPGPPSVEEEPEVPGPAIEPAGAPPTEAAHAAATSPVSPTGGPAPSGAPVTPPPPEPPDPSSGHPGSGHPGPPTGQFGPPPGWPGASGHPAPPPGWPHPPYGYPVLPPAPRPHGLALAPLGARLTARLIDIGVVLLLNVLVNGWFVWQYVQEVAPLFAEAWRRSIAGDPSTEGLPQPDPRADNLILVILLLTAALWFAYEVPAVANSGQTFGKRVTGVKVVPVVGEQQLGLGRSFRRWNTLGLPVLLWYCCGIGLVLQLVDCAFPLFDRPLRQALHDKRAQTVVVQVPRQPTAPTRPDDRLDTPGGSA